MDENQLKLLWRLHAEKNGGFSSYDEFKSLMGNTNARKVYFDAANSQLGFKDYSEFENVLSGSQKSQPKISSGGEEAIHKLYSAVSNQLDVGDYDSFKSNMQTTESRKRFYNAVSGKGYDIGPYDSFEQRLSGHKNSARMMTIHPLFTVSLGGSAKFGNYNDFKELISTNNNYRKQFYSQFGSKILGSYNDFEDLVKNPVENATGNSKPSSGTSAPSTSTFDPNKFMAQSRAATTGRAVQDNVSTQAPIQAQVAKKEVAHIKQNQANAAIAKPITATPLQPPSDSEPNMDANQLTDQIKTDFPEIDPDDVLGNKDVLSGYFKQKNDRLQQQISGMEGSEKKGVYEMDGSLEKLKKQQAELTAQAHHFLSIHAGLEGGGDAVKTGIILGKAMGDPNAASLERRMGKGLTIAPLEKVQTELAGIDARLTILRAKGAQPYSAEYQEIEQQKATILQRNPEALQQVWGNKIGDFIAHDLNGLQKMTGLWTRRLPDVIEQMKAKGINVPDDVAKRITWDDVPTNMDIAGKALEGFVSHFSDKAAGLERMGGSLLGIDPDVLTSDIQQGQQSLNKDFMLNTPTSEQYSVNPHGAVLAGEVFKHIASLGAFVLDASNMSKIAGNLGATEAAAQHIGTDAVVFTGAYEGNYQKALQIIGDRPADEGKRNLSAIIGSSIDAAVFHLPIPKYGAALLGDGKQEVINVLKDLPKDLKGLTAQNLETTFTKYLQKPLAKLLEAGQSTTAEALKFGAMQTAGVVLHKISQSVIADNEAASKDWENVPAEIKDTWATLPVSLMPGVFGMNLLGAGKASAFKKNATYDAFLNPERTMADLDKAHDAQLIPDAEYKARKEVIDVGSKLAKQVPQLNPETGLPLSRTEQVTWVNNRLQETALEAKKASVKDDKVLSKLYDEKIKTLQGEREMMLRKEAFKPKELKREDISSKILPEKQEDVTDNTQPSLKNENGILDLQGEPEDISKPIELSIGDKKEWTDLPLSEKLRLAKENLPEVADMSDTEVAKIADKRAKELLGQHGVENLPEATFKAADTIKPETADKIVSDDEITPEILPEIEHLFTGSPYTPEDLEAVKEDVGEGTPTDSKSGITKEAEDLLNGLTSGSKPTFITKNLERIAKENGIEITNKMSADDVINALKQNKELPTQKTKDGQANNGSTEPEPESRQKDAGSTDNTQSGDAGKTPSAESAGSTDKGDGSTSVKKEVVKSRIHTEKFKKVADNFRESEIPKWLVNNDPTLNKHGISGEDLKEVLAKSIETVGVLLDRGVDLGNAIKQGADHIIKAVKELHGPDLNPDFEKQIRDGFETDVRKNYQRPEEEGYTSIKKAFVNQARHDEGKSALDVATGQSDEERFKETKAKIESGEISTEHIRDAAHAIATDDSRMVTNLSATEIQHALIYDRNTLHNAAKEIDNSIIEAQERNDEKTLAELQVKKAQNDLLQEDNDLAAAKSGTELSSAFRARQLGIKNDYSLAALTRKYKAAGDGSIPEATKSKLSEYAKIIESKDALLAEVEQAKAAADAEIESLRKLNEALKAKRDAFKKLKDEVSSEQKTAKQTRQVESKETLKKEREVIKASLEDKWKKFSRGQLNAGIPLPIEMIPDLVKLAKNYIKEGIVNLDGVIDRVHDFVSEFMDVDKNDLRDAITGYGKVKKPNNDPIEKTFRDLTAQGRLVAAIEDANKGENPKKSGAQRDAPTKEQRDLKKELNKAIKDNNIQVVSPEKQMKSALDAAKTRLSNQIEDLTEAIANHEKITKDAKGIEYDDEAKALLAERDAKRAEYDEIFGTTKELTDEQRIERAEKLIKNQLQKLHDRIDSRDVSVKTSPQLKSDNLTKLRAEREELKLVYKALLETSGELAKRKLEALKKNIAKRTAYLQEIQKTGNIDKFLDDRVKKKTVLDNEAYRLKAEQQKAKDSVDNMIEYRRFNMMSNLQQSLHWAGRFAKGVLISNPVILARIAGAVAWRGVMKVPTETIKYGISKALPGLASGAHSEAITSRRDLTEHIAKYYSTLFSKQNAKGFVFALKNHNTAEDLALGKDYPKLLIPTIKATNLKTFLQAGFFKTMELLDKNASLHGALKSLASKPEFEAYKITITKNLIREGVTAEELEQPTIQAAVEQMALVKSLRAKFMQDNQAVAAQRAVEDYFKRNNRPEIAEMINGVLPITKIASNYISEEFTKLPIVGLSMGMKQISSYAFGKGSTLTESQKSGLLRTLTFQGVGVFTYLLGVALHSSFNPFYKSSANKYAQKKNDDAEEGLMQLWETLSHSPDAVTFQAGVSHAWVWDKYDYDHPEEPGMSKFMSTLFPALLENARAEVSSSPYLQTDNTVIQPLVTGRGFGKAAANFVKSRLPFTTTANEIAQGKIPVLNKFGIESGHEEEVKPYEVGVSPKGFWDNIGFGIPGWREEIIKRIFEEKNSPKEKTDAELDAADEAKDEKEIKKEKFASEHGLNY